MALDLERLRTLQCNRRAGGAGCYPTLPARMWTSARRLVELVASYQRAPAPKTKTERTLPEADFEFQGGSRRLLGGLILRTRSGEVAFGW